MYEMQQGNTDVNLAMWYLQTLQTEYPTSRDIHMDNIATTHAHVMINISHRNTKQDLIYTTMSTCTWHKIPTSDNVTSITGTGCIVIMNLKYINNIMIDEVWNQ